MESDKLPKRPQVPASMGAMIVSFRQACNFSAWVGQEQRAWSAAA